MMNLEEATNLELVAREITPDDTISSKSSNSFTVNNNKRKMLFVETNHTRLYQQNLPPYQHPYYYNYRYFAHPPMSAFPGHQFNNSKDLYNRKRQRKHAAAAAILSPQSVWNTTSRNSINNNGANNADNNMGRKSTAQPRPVLNVPPRGIGPVVDPNENDVLCGRGGRINSHSGNIQFREIITTHKKVYLAPSTKKLEKAHIASRIVNDIRGMDPPGRFLKEDHDTGLWFDIGDAKAIKKTGQALREDAPDIRPELEGEDSSGDDKGARSVKKEEKKSPKINQSPKQAEATKSTGVATSVSPVAQKQQPAGQVWPKGTSSNQRMQSAHDYQAQVAMPPPSHNHMSSHQEQYPQGFETRNIPIPPPNMKSTHSNFYQLPNQLYSGAQSVTSKLTSTSKQALAVLQQGNNNATVRTHQQLPPDDIAFGRHFHPPEAAQTVLSSDNTMSTISGLSENLSSNMSGGNNDLRASALMNMPLKSSGFPNSSMRLSMLQGIPRIGGRGGYNNDSSLGTLGMSGLSGYASLRGFGVADGGSFPRSFSFNDLNGIVDGDSWRAIMQADDELIDEAAARSILSGGISAKNSLISGRNSGGAHNSTAMSISGLSMDLQSNASSTQWLQAAGLSSIPPSHSAMMGDDRTYMSNMSDQLDALDLASFDPSFGM